VKANPFIVAASAIALAAGCERQAEAQTPAAIEGAVLDQRVAGDLAFSQIERWLDAEGAEAITKLSDSLRQASEDMRLWGEELRRDVLSTLPAPSSGSSETIATAEVYREYFDRVVQDPRVSSSLHALSEALSDLGGIEGAYESNSLLSRMLLFTFISGGQNSQYEEQFLRQTVRTWMNSPAFCVSAEIAADAAKSGQTLASVASELRLGTEALQRAISDDDAEDCIRICKQLRQTALQVDFSRLAEHVLSDGVAIDRRGGDKHFVRDGTWVERPSIQEALRVFLVGSVPERMALESGYEARRRYYARQGE
jgi:hypothetical protein